MLWANGPIDYKLSDGHKFFHQHEFNVGQHVAHNEMLDECVRLGFDWHIRVDDDCWLTTKNWLKRLLKVQDDIKRLTGRHVVLSATVDGLDSPPPSFSANEIGREIVEHVGILGGIFRMSPMPLVRYFRWDERQAMGFGDATQFANFCESAGTKMFRVRGVKASHGESTRGQKAKDSDWDYTHDMLQYVPLGL